MTGQNPYSDVEKMLRSHVYTDSAPNFDLVWEQCNRRVSLKREVAMAEKRGGMGILAWAIGFMVVVGLGWFGLMKFSAVKKQEQIQKGEAIVVTLVVGDVEVKKMGSQQWREVAVEDSLQMGDAIRTSDDSYCELQMVSRGIFRVESASELYLSKLVNENDRVNSKMRLERGGVALKPNHLQDGENFEVETATAVAAVRGTKFSVTVDAGGNTRVAVDEGRVAVRPSLPSIDEAEKKGDVDQAAAAILRDSIAQPIDVVPGEEAKMDAARVQVLDRAVGQAIAEEVKTEGAITAEKLAAPSAAPTAEKSGETPAGVVPASVVSRINTAVVTRVQQEIPVAAGSQPVAGNPLTSAVMAKEEISDEAKKKLDSLSAANIISRATEMIRVRFESKPAGAELVIDGVSVGVTPLERVYEKGKKISVRMVKTNYVEFAKDYEVTAGFNVSEAMTEIPSVAVAGTNEASTNMAAVEDTNADVVAVKGPGDLDWEKEVSFKVSGVNNEPLLYKGKIYITVNNRLVIFSLDGEVIKTVAVVEEGVKLTRPVGGDNQIYIGAEKGGVYVYSPAGELLWKKPDAGSQSFGASPAAGFGLVAVPSIDQGIKVYSSGGQLKQTISEGAPIYSAPILLNGGKTLIYATESGSVVAYDLENNSKKWTKEYGDRLLYPLVGDDSVVVVLIRNSGKVMGLSPVSGDPIWTTELPEIQKTKMNPLYFGGRVVLSLSGERSTVVVLSASKGSVISKVSLNEGIGYPFLSGSSLFLGSASGKVLSFNLSKRTYDWTFKGGSKVGVVVADKDGVYALSAGQMVRIVK